MVVLAVGGGMACGGGPDDAPGATGHRDRLIFAAAADATTLDPHNTTDTESDQVIMMVYEPLIAFDDTMKIVPRLAERWSGATTASPGRSTCGSGIRFHDGAPFDAEAVRLNFARVLDPVANHKRLSLFSMIDRVEAVDPLTVRIVTKYPFGAFEPTIAHVSSAIVSPVGGRRRTARRSAVRRRRCRAPGPTASQLEEGSGDRARAVRRLLGRPRASPARSSTGRFPRRRHASWRSKAATST